MAADSESGSLWVIRVVLLRNPSIHSHLVVIFEILISQIIALFKLDSATRVAKLNSDWLGVVGDVEDDCLVPDGT